MIRHMPCWGICWVGVGRLECWVEEQVERKVGFCENTYLNGKGVMSEVLTIDEIEARFPEEWVFIVDPDTGPDLKLRTSRTKYGVHR